MHYVARIAAFGSLFMAVCSIGRTATETSPVLRIGWKSAEVRDSGYLQVMKRGEFSTNLGFSVTGIDSINLIAESAQSDVSLRKVKISQQADQAAYWIVASVGDSISSNMATVCAKDWNIAKWIPTKFTYEIDFRLQTMPPQIVRDYFKNSSAGFHDSDVIEISTPLGYECLNKENSETRETGPVYISIGDTNLSSNSVAIIPGGYRVVLSKTHASCLDDLLGSGPLYFGLVVGSAALVLVVMIFHRILPTFESYQSSSPSHYATIIGTVVSFIPVLAACQLYEYRPISETFWVIWSAIGAFFGCLIYLAAKPAMYSRCWRVLASEPETFVKLLYKKFSD